tara:strand:+ start:2500 stop:3294 length:795 start_codon:yes stop_codon:yes gene_type:complete
MKNTFLLLFPLGLAAAAIVLFSQSPEDPGGPALDMAFADSSKAADSPERGELAGVSPDPGATRNQVVLLTQETTPDEELAVDPTAAERASILAQLRDRSTTASERSKLWRRLAELGVADEVIAELQALIEESPNDTDLQAMLGNALITKMRSQDLGPVERRTVTQGAMTAFDKALDLDPQNWTARFSRAMTNSSAPAFLGLQKDAIADFETLLSQQRESPLSDDHAHTFFFLSNLHDGSGNGVRASEIRAEGATLFPGDERFQD